MLSYLVGAHDKIILLHPFASYDALAYEMGVEMMYGLGASPWFPTLCSQPQQGRKTGYDGTSLSELYEQRS